MVEYTVEADLDAVVSARDWLEVLLEASEIGQKEKDDCRLRMTTGLSPEKYGPQNYLSQHMLAEAREEVLDTINHTALWLANMNARGEVVDDAIAAAGCIVVQAELLLDALVAAGLEHGDETGLDRED